MSLSPLTSPVYAHTHTPFPNWESEHFEGVTFSFIFVLLILIVFCSVRFMVLFKIFMETIELNRLHPNPVFAT